MRVCCGAPFVVAYKSLIKPIVNFFLGKNVNKVENSQAMPSLKAETPPHIRASKYSVPIETINFEKVEASPTLGAGVISAHEKLIGKVTALKDVYLTLAVLESKEMTAALDNDYPEEKIEQLMKDLGVMHEKLDALLRKITASPDKPLAPHNVEFLQLKDAPLSVINLHNFCKKNAVTCDANLNHNGLSLFATFGLAPIKPAE